MGSTSVVKLRIKDNLGSGSRKNVLESRQVEQLRPSNSLLQRGTPGTFLMVNHLYPPNLMVWGSEKPPEEKQMLDFQCLGLSQNSATN